MKRHGGLWDDLVRWDNLILAARKARRGKRQNPTVQRFEFKREYELLRLRSELIDGSYRPGAFHTHWITRPKNRLISAAPYRDRVVHHALMILLEPILERHFHHDSYACRKAKGTHAAAQRLQFFMRRSHYAVHCDIIKYFPGIDHEILKGVYRRLIKDRHVLTLLDLIVDGSNQQEAVPAWFPGDDLWSPLERRRGLPIGNLTSQWLANWFLNDLDHLMCGLPGVTGFVRYCDDFVILGQTRANVREGLEQASAFLATRRLRLHTERLVLTPVKAGLTFVGYRIFPTKRLLPMENVRKLCRRVRWMRKAWKRRQIDRDEIAKRLVSWFGHARPAQSERLIAKLSFLWRM